MLVRLENLSDYIGLAAQAYVGLGMYVEALDYYN